MSWASTRTYTGYLGADEVIVLEERRHPAVLLRPFSETVGAIVIASLLGSVTSPGRGDAFVDTLLGWITIVFVARFLWKCLEWGVDHIVVTDQRMFEVSGILTRKVASMPLVKLTDLTYRRTLVGRALGYGELVVETPGQRQALTHIAYLPHSRRFYRRLNDLVMAYYPKPVAEAGEEPGVEVGDEDTGPLPRVIV